MLTAAMIEQVALSLREVAEQQVLPRFRHLRQQDIEEKAPGELVTIADREAERDLTRRLLKLLPGSRVVGEEATAAEPDLLQHLDQGWIWLVDPVDGTSNFAAGREEFAMMVSLLSSGQVVAAWILEPLTGDLWQAEVGGGCWLNAVRQQIQPSPDWPQVEVVVKPRFLPTALQQRCQAPGLDWPSLSLGSGSCGIDYPRLLTGQYQALVFGRTLAWDHAPGSLLVREAGGWSNWLDQRPYRPGEQAGVLLVAASEPVWAQFHQLLTAAESSAAY